MTALTNGGALPAEALEIAVKLACALDAIDRLTVDGVGQQVMFAVMPDRGSRDGRQKAAQKI